MQWVVQLVFPLITSAPIMVILTGVIKQRVLLNGSASERTKRWRDIQSINNLPGADFQEEIYRSIASSASTHPYR